MENFKNVSPDKKRKWVIQMEHEELLKKYYLNSSDVSKILGVSQGKALKVISEIQEEMKDKKYYIPESRKKVCLTKLFKKRYGL